MKRLMVLSVVLLASCTLGPNYQRPSLPLPDTWRGSAPAAPVNLAWWEKFQDPELRSLIHQALETSHDLRIAVARVDQARALAGITRSEQFPRIDAGANGSRNRFSETTEPRGFGGERDHFTVAVDLSFEIDIWGRLRRANEAARAELLATEEARAAVVFGAAAVEAARGRGAS